MRHSEFWELMDGEFGAGYARVLAGSQVIPSLGRTVDDALAAGVAPKTVWAGVCEQMQVPPARRWGAQARR